MRGGEALADGFAQAAATKMALRIDGMISGMDPVRVVFMGTPEIAVPVLEAVLGLGDRWPVVGVYAAPDRRSGRGREIRRAPVKAFAEARGLPVFSPVRLTTPEEGTRFEAQSADLIVLAAYGLLLPKPFLEGPRFGAVNVHPSLLPRHRGATPVAAAILAGDASTGVSVIVMDEGLDTGPMLAQTAVELDGTERTPDLTERLFELGAGLLTGLLPGYVAGELGAVPQPRTGATVVKRLAKADGDLDWTKPALQLERQVRAYDPWPGSATTWGGKRLEVLDAGVAEAGAAAPGQVVVADGAIGVGTADGLLVRRAVKLEGRSATTADEFVRGHRDFVGTTLPS